MRKVAVIFGLCLWFAPSHARDLDPSQIDQAEEQARNAYIQQFGKFTEDKNVMGKATTPDGKATGGGRKTRFNRDDKAPFQSDLTYHDNAFNVPEQLGDPKNPNDKNAKVRTLFSFVSDHGKISGAGGSSLLERTVYGLHNRFSKEDEDPDKNANKNAKEGVRFESIFKVETKQVVNKGQDGAGKDGKDDQPDEIKRRTMRDEAKTEVVKVGEDSFETIKRSARDEENQDDEKTMPNLTFLYEAAKRASEAMWNATLANLGQRRINRGIRGGELEKPQLSQDFPNCEEWANELNKQLQQRGNNDPQLAKNQQAELARINQQCKQIAKVDYKTINPRFEEEENNKGGNGKANEVLKTGDVNKEDEIQRDLRVQLEVMAKAGKSANDVPSNWKYNKQDEQSKLLEFDEGGNETGVRQATIADQLAGYNNQLAEAEKGYEEVSKRIPIDVPNLKNYYLDPGEKSVMDINRPTQSQMEEFGMNAEEPPPMADSYEEVIQQ